MCVCVVWYVCVVCGICMCVLVCCVCVLCVCGVVCVWYVCVVCMCLWCVYMWHTVYVSGWWWYHRHTLGTLLCHVAVVLGDSQALNVE